MRRPVDRAMTRCAGLRARIESALQALWFTPRPSARQRLTRALLAPLAALTGWIATRRRAAIGRLDRAPVPVVVVGNLIVGGAGKTPLVLALVDALKHAGWNPGIIASGYGARSRAPRLVAADDDAIEHGDEPVLLARRSGQPVAAGRERRRAIDVLLQTHPEIDVIVSDDGLQHRHLPRDIEIAVFDERGAGNGRCLPAGPLRAPLQQATGFDAIVSNGSTQIPFAHARHFTSHIEPLHFVTANRDAVEAPLQQFVRQCADVRVVAVAGIGAPQRFFASLRELGIDARTIGVADHAALAASDLAAIDADIVIMTEKDAVKCLDLADERCWALLVRAIPAPGLVDWLIGRLHGLTPARNSCLPTVQGSAGEMARRPGR